MSGTPRSLVILSVDCVARRPRTLPTLHDWTSPTINQQREETARLTNHSAETSPDEMMTDLNFATWISLFCAGVNLSRVVAETAGELLAERFSMPDQWAAR